MSVVRFHVLGPPVGKQRARVIRTTSGRARTITPTKTKEYEHAVHLKAKSALERLDIAEPLNAPLRVLLQVGIEVPSTWSSSRRAAALSGEVHPTGKPDIDNVAKAVLDAMNSVVYVDDAQIVELTSRKAYGPLAGVLVTVETLET